MTDSFDEYDIQASSTLSDRATRVLKHGGAFAVLDGRGDVRFRGPRGVSGIYFEDTRHLSRLEWWIGDTRPLLLSSNVGRATSLLTSDQTNPDLELRDKRVKSDRLHVRRETFLLDRSAHIRIELFNYSDETIEVPLRWVFDADFADVFEVRGAERQSPRGRIERSVVGDDEVHFVYGGAQGFYRETRLSFSPVPSTLAADLATVLACVESHGSTVLHVTVECFDNPERASVADVAAFDRNRMRLAHQNREVIARGCRIRTSNAVFDQWVQRSYADLVMLTTETEHGPYPYAGTPWFSTVFGRDGLITGLQYLWVDPAITRGVLSVLAAHQAEEVVPDQDAEPGKIVHELRSGEMAVTGEVPFARYYGSVDSTPLFVWLVGEYFQRTGDVEFAERMWPHLQRALVWIEEWGDRDGDGYVEYGRRAAHGLVHQGWKDSHDSIFHKDGSDAIGPIALCEVQAYVYAAFLSAALIAEGIGKSDEAQMWRTRAANLRERFVRDFWLSDERWIALALDGHKNPCRVVASNAGHCLLTGILDRSRVDMMMGRFFDEDLYCGWGIRTLSRRERRYNPMSYHNGSVWPHDNAMIALGMARSGYSRGAARLLDDLFEAASSFDQQRLPELFCGFDRAPARDPTRYPVACSPQAWASGTVFMLLQACLGLSIDARERRVAFTRPVLPESITELSAEGLRICDAELDFVVRRHPEDIAVEVTRRVGDLEVVIVK